MTLDPKSLDKKKELWTQHLYSEADFDAWCAKCARDPETGKRISQGQFLTAEKPCNGLKILDEIAEKEIALPEEAFAVVFNACHLRDLLDSAFWDGIGKHQAVLKLILRKKPDLKREILSRFTRLAIANIVDEPDLTLSNLEVLKPLGLVAKDDELRKCAEVLAPNEQRRFNLIF